MAITLLQDAFSLQFEVSPVALPYASNVTAGNLLVVVLYDGNAAASVLGCTDSQGNTWTPVVNDSFSNLGTTSVWWAIAKSSGPCTVSLTSDNPNSNLYCFVQEWASTTGWPTNPFDTYTSATGIGTSRSSGSITTSQDGELVMGFAPSGTTTIQTGFTRTVNGGPYVEYIVQPTAGAIAVTDTSGFPSAWEIFVLAFKPTIATPPITSSKYWRTVVIDHTKVSADQTDFPVMVAGTVPEFKSVANGGHIESTNPHQPFDLQFWSDSALSTAFNWEVSYWDPTTGAIEVYVRIPSLSSTADTTIYASYGNASITTLQGDPTAVWVDYAAVYHFGFNPADNTTALDSTSNGRNGAATGSATLNAVDSFNGTSLSCEMTLAQYSSVQLPDLMGTPEEITLETWFNISPGKEGAFGSRLFDLGGKIYVQAGSNGSGSQFLWNGGDSVNYFGGFDDSTWYHVAWSLKPGSQNGYVNGSNQVSATDAGALDDSSPTNTNTWLGVSADHGGTGFDFGGLMDEFRVSNVARSDSWMSTQYSNMSSPSTFFALGAEQSSGHTFTLTLTDSIVLVELFHRSVGKKAMDAIMPTDSLSRHAAKKATDALVVSDAIARATSRHLLEGLSVVDSVAKKPIKTMRESLSLTDRLSKACKKAIRDAIHPTDSLRKSAAKTFREALSLLEKFVHTGYTGITAVRRFAAQIWQRLWLADECTRTFKAETNTRHYLSGEEMLFAQKDSESVEDFQIDFSDVLVTPDVINSSTWTVPTGITLVSSANTSTTSTARLSGGSVGKSYVVGIEASLASGQILVQRLKISIGPA